MSIMIDQKTDQPDTPGLAWRRQWPALEIVLDVFAGTLALRAKQTKYLPRFPKETTDGYEARLHGAVLYNAFRRTIGGLVGMVFRRDPVLGDDVPAPIREHWENIDLAGRHGAVFARDVFEAALRDGHTHIFVDFAEIDDAVAPRTRAEETAAGLRPWWVHVTKEQLIRFRAAMIAGQTVLTEIAWKETHSERAGRYGERETQRIRIYRLETTAAGLAVVWEVHEKRKDEKGQEQWQLIRTDTMTRDRIPLVTVYANRTAFMESDPPLLDLALENIGHYQVRSDRRNSLHIAGVPIPYFVGVPEEQEIVVGSDLGIKIPMGGSAGYLEPTGAALNEMREELRDIEQRMAALGLAMLERETRAAETAEAKRIDKSTTDSQLAAAARGLQDALEEAQQIHAEWLRLRSGGSVTINRDFERQTLDPAMIAELRELVLSGTLSIDTLWDLLVAGEVLPEDFDPELERVRIESSGIEQRTGPPPGQAA